MHPITDIERTSAHLWPYPCIPIAEVLDLSIIEWQDNMSALIDESPQVSYIGILLNHRGHSPQPTSQWSNFILYLLSSIINASQGSEHFLLL